MVHRFANHDLWTLISVESPLQNKINIPSRIGGDSVRSKAFVQGESLNKSNILIDYKVLKKELNAVLDTLDHKDLNELPDFKGESPSSEMISAYIYNKLKERIVQLSKITVWETQTSCCSYFEAE
mgnify:CR=1 FL=1